MYIWLYFLETKDNVEFSEGQPSVHYNTVCVRLAKKQLMLTSVVQSTKRYLTHWDT